MNYAAVFLVFILLAAAVFWYVGGRRYYTGPVVEAQADDASESDRVSSAADRKADKETHMV
jgi:hypothetical protein